MASIYLLQLLVWGKKTSTTRIVFWFGIQSLLCTFRAQSYKLLGAYLGT